MPQGRARPGPAAVSGSPEEGPLDEGKEGSSAEYDGESGDGEREDEGEARDAKRCTLDGAAAIPPGFGVIRLIVDDAVNDDKNQSVVSRVQVLP